jgi:hypothetical protein
MAISTASSVTLSTTEERAAVASTASSESVAKTPDYHLPYTGDQVLDALYKIINLDIDALQGSIGYTTLTSSEANPLSLDTVVDAGFYTVDYVTGKNLPDGVDEVTPLRLDVYVNEEGTTFQVLDVMGNKWYRYRKTDGTGWSDWTAKPTNASNIDPDADPETTDPDPIDALDERVTALEKQISDGVGDVSYGTEEDGAAMLNGTYDYTATPSTDEASAS